MAILQALTQFRIERLQLFDGSGEALPRVDRDAQAPEPGARVERDRIEGFVGKLRPGPFLARHQAATDQPGQLRSCIAQIHRRPPLTIHG